MWVDILLPKSKPILVGICYRPPDQSNFVDLFEELCSSCADFSKTETIILGEFNIDMQKKDNSGTKALLNFSRLFDLHQMIDKPTRVCATSQSVIDLIFVSDPSRILSSDVAEYGLSDHSITYCTRKIQKTKFTSWY